MPGVAENEVLISPLAGKPAPKDMLVDVARLEREYFERRPDLEDPNQRVSFGTSGHRGSPLNGSFTEAHILAITQAICDYRRAQGADGPLFMGKDTHALSGPAQRTALEVLAGNQRRTRYPTGRRRNSDTRHLASDPCPQPWPQGTSRGRYCHNALTQSSRGWRLQVQPDRWWSRRYGRDPLDGGAGQRDVASRKCRRQTDSLRRSPQRSIDASGRFCPALRQRSANVVDMDAIRDAGLKLAVDPLGGAACALLGADQCDL